MAGASFVASTRGTFDATAKAVTLVTPAAVRKGDVLVALLAHNAADPRGSVPHGWTQINTQGAEADVLDVYARMIADSEPSSVDFHFTTVANECQGALVAFRGTAPGVLLEHAATVASAATTTLATAAPSSQQAINVILSVWTCAGSQALALPAGLTLVDSFSTAIVAARSMLVGYRRAGATGLITLGNVTVGSGTSSDVTSGRSFSFTVRDRLPVQPAALVDLVPGNIGLIGKDTRRVR